MKDGQIGDQMYHGTGTLLTMDLTGILLVRTVMYYYTDKKYLCVNKYLCQNCFVCQYISHRW